MKAAAIQQHGGVEAIEILDLPEPAPRAGEVVLAVRAAALNHLDVWVRQGGRVDIPMPHVLGSDAAGTVAAVGKGVESVAVGDEVVLSPGMSCGACPHCRRGEDSVCANFQIIGLHTQGTFAEKVAVPAANALPKPPGLPFEEAAALPIAYVTAWRMLLTRARLQPGERLLVHGVGGGVGTAGLQLGRLVGAEVIVTSSSDAKLAKARDLGAAHTINYRTADVAAAVRERTDGQGVDVILDSVGAATWQTNFAAIRRGGRIVHCGVTTGAEATVSIQDLYWNQVTVMGSTYGSRDDLHALLRALAATGTRPALDSTFPLAQARAAARRMEDAEQFGKIVLQVGS